MLFDSCILCKNYTQSVSLLDIPRLKALEKPVKKE